MPDLRSFLRPDVLSRIESLELRARLVVEGFITGLHRSPYHGFSVEFAEHRQYMPGDEIRAIDWKVYGRTDRYYIKQYEEETNLKGYVVVDASASMGYASEGNPTKFSYATSLAAALALLMIRQRDAAGVGVYDTELRNYLPASSRGSYLQEILRTLANARTAGGTGTARSLHLMAERIRRRGLVIVISDFFDEPAQVISALKHFRHKRNEVVAMQLLDPLERTFNFGNDATFRDMETGEEMVTQPYQIRAAYAQAMTDFTEHLKRECREHGIDYVLMDTATPFDKALAEYLNKRKTMG
ncbi:MAG: DUF58 domain-containing protein [Chlorobi bacterium]|nr:MAG: von Willebrand factor type A [Chlorobi bacterium OLB7]MBK8910224.1 DUF58 domain-containing protein [Chlorobiota bacterium]MBX7217195.1 DUF58 domain-containing protein [Candidatus Kapabacteria bacterium]